MIEEIVLWASRQPQRDEWDPLPEWTDAFAQQALEEGWGLDDAFQIVRDDDEQRFRHDFAAMIFVQRRAAAGSAMHRVALSIHQRFARPEESGVE